MGNWKELFKLLPLWTRSNVTSTRSWPKLSKSKKKFKPNWNKPKRKLAPFLLNSSRPRTLMKKPLMPLKLLREKTRTSKRKLPIFPINWPNLANPSTNSKSPREPSMLNVTNSKLPSKKPKPPLNPKKLRFSASKSKLPKANKTSSAELPKRTKKLTTPDVTDNVPLNPCKPLLTLKSVPAVKLSESRRRWNLTSTTSKSNSAMLTDNALKPKRPSRLSKVKTRTSKLALMMPKEQVKILPSKLPSLTDAPTSSNPNWTKCVLLLNKLNVAVNWLKANFLNPTNVVVSFTLKTLL